MSSWLKRVLNPETNEEEAKFVCIPLDLSSRMTKSEAREALRMEVTSNAGQWDGPMLSLRQTAAAEQVAGIIAEI